MTKFAAIALFFIAQFNSKFIFAQTTINDLSLARQVIDTLCSPIMCGRGYSNNGNTNAAQYIAAQFAQIGLQTPPNLPTYQQPFTVSANTFSGAMHVAINQKTLVAGQDYQINPSSVGKKGTFDLKIITAKQLLNDRLFKKLLHTRNNKKALLFDYPDSLATRLNPKQEQLSNALDAPLYLHLTNQKLTWHISTQANQATQLTLKQDALPMSPKTVTVDIDNEQGTHQTANVVGFVRGTAQPDSFLVFTAHYDHLGQMGRDTYIPGANDNAAGVAMLLDLARYFVQKPARYSILFIAFSAEELGLLGSQYYVENPIFPLKNIRFLVNTDIVGTGNEGITVVNATEFSADFAQLKTLNDTLQLLPQIKLRGKAANSDHYPFYEKGVHCFFIYTLGGIKAYHDIYDRPETLPLTKFTELKQLIIAFMEKQSGN
ncbi:MAG: M28 family peptidase [Chitinophagales bacterium]|nr:M28 family peptidase [Chitinophagales bacterium]